MEKMKNLTAKILTEYAANRAKDRVAVWLLIATLIFSLAVHIYTHYENRREALRYRESIAAMVEALREDALNCRPVSKAKVPDVGTLRSAFDEFIVEDSVLRIRHQ